MQENSKGEYLETVSHLVREELENKPFLLEALGRGIVSHAGLAEELKRVLEKGLRKTVKTAAITMAIRRFALEIEKKNKVLKNFQFKGELNIKTGICDLNFRKTSTILSRTRLLYQEVEPGRGDFLNIIIGSNEISIAVSEQHADKVLRTLKGEKLLARERDLVALTVIFHHDFVHTPGVIYNILRKLAWERINIFEVISTMTELTLILKKSDSMKAYELLEDYAS